MKKIMLAALFAALPAVAFAGHETPLVGEVKASSCGHTLDGYELTGLDARPDRGMRVEMTGTEDGRCDHCGKQRFRVSAFHGLRDARHDFTVRGSVLNRPHHGRVFAGYTIAGRGFDPAAVRGVREVRCDDFEVVIRPRCDDPSDARYAVVVFTEASYRIWDGCRYVCRSKFGSSYAYTLDRGRWSDGCTRFRRNVDADVAVWIR